MNHTGTASLTEVLRSIRDDDTGVGIEPEFLPHVFDELRRAEDVKKHRGA